jgi:hypothetical protein
MAYVVWRVMQPCAAQVVFELVDNLDIERELEFIEKSSPLAYDGWLGDGSIVVDLLTNTHMVAPIEAFIARDTKIQWSDVTEYMRFSSSTYGGSTIGVPGGSAAGKVLGRCWEAAGPARGP